MGKALGWGRTCSGEKQTRFLPLWGISSAQAFEQALSPFWAELDHP